jgi:glycosyltransferase involved in cell wall biosynthesis
MASKTRYAKGNRTDDGGTKLNTSVNPIISIITPCWNSEKYIEKTINSVIGQDYSNIEYIIIDGGSTDATRGIIEAYSDRIAYWRSEPDGGMYDAINKGMRQAKGEIVAYLNSDDFYYPGTLSFVAQYFRENPNVDLLYGDVNFVNTNDSILFKQSYPSFSPLRFRAMRHAAIGQPAAFWRNNFSTLVGEFDSAFRMAADFEFFIRAGQIGRLVHIPKILAAFRVHEESMTQSQIKVSQTEVAEIHRRYLNPEDRWQHIFNRFAGNIQFKAINFINWPRRLRSLLANISG